MPKFCCPRCRHVHREPDERIGAVVSCLGCQQKLRVPERGLGTGLTNARAVESSQLPDNGGAVAESTYRLSAGGPAGGTVRTGYQLSALAQKVMEDYEVYSGAVTPAQPQSESNQTASAEGSDFGNHVVAMGKGMGAALLLRGFLGPLGDVVGAAVATNASSKRADERAKATPTYGEWKRKCERAAESSLKLRGLPTRPIGRLARLILEIRAGQSDTLIEMLRTESDPVSRRGAVAALGYLGPCAAPAIPLLREALTDREALVCKHAVIALGRIGGLRDYLPEILAALLQPDSRLPALDTLDAIRSVEPLIERTWPAVVAGLCDADAGRAHRALLVLKSGSPALARPAGPLLVQALAQVNAAPAGAGQASTGRRDNLLGALQYADPVLARRQLSVGEKLRRAVRPAAGVLVALSPFVLAFVAYQRGLINFDSFRNRLPSPAATSGIDPGTPPSALELTESFDWKLPEGWQRTGAEQRTGALGGKFLTFHVTSAALPSVKIQCDVKRVAGNESDMVARMQRTTAAANLMSAGVRWLPAKAVGRRTVHAYEMQTGRQMSRNYRWLVPERSLECNVAVTAAAAEFTAAMTAIEASLESAIAGQPAGASETPSAESPLSAEPGSEPEPVVAVPDDAATETEAPSAESAAVEAQVK